MGNFISNRPISCNYCGNTPVRGREAIKKDRHGNLIHECKWVCGRCGNVVRKDSNPVNND